MSRAPKLDRLLERGLNLQRAGRLREAAAIFSKVLAAQPRHAGALHWLGVLALSSGRTEEAAGLLERAVELDPNNVGYLSNLGEAFRLLGRLRDAVAAHVRALAVKPDFAEGFHRLALVLEQNGEIEGAIFYLERAVDLDPGQPALQRSLGEALRRQGDLARAAGHLSCADLLSSRPAASRALHLDHLASARALRDRGSLAGSVAHYHCAMALDPRSVDALVELSGVLEALERPEGAALASSRALRVDPHSAMAHATLAAARVLQRRYDEAVACCRSALALDPDCWLAHFHLGYALAGNGEAAEAISSYRKAAELRPDRPAAQSALLFLMPYAPGYDAPAVGAEARAWARRHAALLAGEVRPHPNDRDPERRLRVGFISPDLYEHPISLFLEPLLRNFDRQRVEVFCYSSVRSPDPVTERLRAQTDVWRDVLHASDAELAEIIREDRIDLAVDLTMHASGGRPLLFARKPAPVQICWLAYVGTTGLAAMDYRITDPHLEPPGLDAGWSTEAPLVLPDTYWCYAPWQPARDPGPLPDVGPLPAASSGRVTFGAQHSIQKVNDGVVSLWARVLRAVEGSRLVMFAPEGARARLLGVFERCGVEPARLDFLALRGRREYLSAYGRMDVGLDTFPVSGATTSLDAFWMGVPVVTLAGQTPPGRAGVSIATNLGLPELIAGSEDEYVRASVELTRDLGKLADLRAGLRGRMEASPLMDAEKYARDVERAYRSAWKNWCAGTP
jgi:predicted O-linked N-acetylglucosamine transferase (SPINDLY family)